MKLAFTQAGFIFGGWFTSCLSCLSPAKDDESFRHQEALKRKGVEREMKICHSQPHLVPPMRLVLYDDMPSPVVPPRTATLPSWVIEGKNRMSRASGRATSLSTRRKSPAVSRLRISAPTDFRRVNPPSARLAAYRPLELSIYTPGNRLSELPTFEGFGIEDEQQLLTPPARIFSSPWDRPQQCSSLQYRLRRKPVGSGSNRTSLANLEQLQLLEGLEDSITSPLIPHFSNRIQSLAIGVEEAHSRDSAVAGGPGPSVVVNEEDSISGHSSHPKGPTSSTLHDDRPLPPLPILGGDIDSPDGPTTPLVSRPPPHTPSGSNRVSQWLFSASTSSSPDSKISPNTSPHQHKISAPSRSRTLSDTNTISSEMTCMTSTTTTTKRPTPSLSSAITAATTADTLRVEKEYELAMNEYPIALPMGNKYFHDLEKYQREHHRRQHGVDELDHTGREVEVDELVYSNDAVRGRRSVVGLAF